MQNQKSNKKSGKKQKKQANSQMSTTDGAVAAPFGSTRLPKIKSLNLVIPDKMFTRLQYNGAQTLTIAVGGGGTAIRYRPTGVFDVDPLLGGTSVPGFVELAALYSGYRVVASKITVSAVGLDTRPILFGTLPLNADPGASPSLTTLQSFMMNPYHKYLLAGGAGSPPKVLSKYMSTEQLWGSKQVYFDDNFSSAVTSVPNNNWYWVVFLVTSGIVTTSNQSTVIDVKISMDVEFFSRKELLN